MNTDFSQREIRFRNKTTCAPLIQPPVPPIIQSMQTYIGQPTPLFWPIPLNLSQDSLSNLLLRLSQQLALIPHSKKVPDQNSSCTRSSQHAVCSFCMVSCGLQPLLHLFPPSKVYVPGVTLQPHLDLTLLIPDDPDPFIPPLNH